jgi:hypothetical protein
MNLDFVISQGTSLVISGWVAYKSLSINQKKPRGQVFVL